MRIDDAMVMVLTEESEKTIYRIKPEEYSVKNIVLNTRTTKKVFLDWLSIMIRDEIINIVNGSGGGGVALPEPHMKTNGEKDLVASTIYTDDILSEQSDTPIIEGLFKKLRVKIKRWSGKVVLRLYNSKTLGENKAEIKNKIIIEARKIKSLETLRETFFWDIEKAELEEIVKQADKLLLEILTIIKNSIRGTTSQKFGTAMETTIAKALKEGNFSVINGLETLKDILDIVTPPGTNSLTVKKPRANSLAYDIEIKIPYSRDILLGVHIKLVISKSNIVSMNNGTPIFTASSFEKIKNMLEERGIDYEKYIRNPTRLKKEKVITFRTVDFLKDFIGSKTIITNKKDIKLITLLCRVNEDNSIWVVVYPGGSNVSFSEDTSKIKVEKKEYLFINKNNDIVFRMDKDTGRTTPVLSKKRSLDASS